MYNQNFQTGFSNQTGAPGFVGSQYRGMGTKYQPVGMVQSQYNQSLNNPSFGSQFGTSQSFSQIGSSQQFGASQFGASQNPQSYHTANYRGDQQGHDAYLRADSVQPAQSQFGIGATGFGASSFGASGIGSANQSQFSQFTSPQSYHTANYRGDQPGHDAYLRADSTQPAQSGFGIGASSFGSQFASASAGNFNQSAQFGQATNPQSYHTANYRGNQQNHDAYLRADSTQPAQSQFGMGGMNRYQF